MHNNRNTPKLITPLDDRIDHVYESWDELNQAYKQYKEEHKITSNTIIDTVIQEFDIDNTLDYIEQNSFDKNTIFSLMMKMGITQIKPYYIFDATKKEPFVEEDAMINNLYHYIDPVRKFRISIDGAANHSVERDVLGRFFCEMAWHLDASQIIHDSYRDYVRDFSQPDPQQAEQLMENMAIRDIYDFYESLRLGTYDMRLLSEGQRNTLKETLQQEHYTNIYNMHFKEKYPAYGSSERDKNIDLIEIFGTFLQNLFEKIKTPAHVTNKLSSQWDLIDLDHSLQSTGEVFDLQLAQAEIKIYKTLEYLFSQNKIDTTYFFTLVKILLDAPFDETFVRQLLPLVQKYSHLTPPYTQVKSTDLEQEWYELRDRLEKENVVDYDQKRNFVKTLFASIR